MDEPLWILGYGSLIFKPPPHASEPIPGFIKGYVRRFWQSSSDHRGIPSKKGRVVTLISSEDVIKNEGIRVEVEKYNDLNDLEVQCCVYYIRPDRAQEVQEYLDIREQDGYTLHNIEFHIDPQIKTNEEIDEILNQLPVNNGLRSLNCKVYIGKLDNESFIGPEEMEKTGEIIREAKGPSGTNKEYLEKLVHSLRALGEDDYYLEELLDVASSFPTRSE